MAEPKARSPRSKLYDGQLYARLVDPMLFGVRGFVADKLPPGDRVLDACCGTGALARALAGRGRRVTGVDLSPRNIEYARRLGGPESLRFEVGDVSRLEVPAAGRYDVATVVLALHEMPAETRGPVLDALLRVADRVMVVDFAAPMPWSLAGARNRLMEAAAGLEHLRAYRDYQRRGGLSALVESGVAVESERWIDSKTLHVLVIRGDS